VSAADHPSLGLLVAVLATWRICHLIAREDGPFDVVTRLRERAGDGVIGTLMDCVYCLSLWWSIPFAVYLALTWHLDPLAAAGLWIGISGGASLAEQATDRSTSSSIQASP
jgi:hypothetical protein